MLKVLAGLVLGFLLFNSPQARRVTADLMRTGADLLDPPSLKVTPPLLPAVPEQGSTLAPQ